MTEIQKDLSGFTPVTPLERKVFQPQSLQVPDGKDDFLANSAKIIEALWDCVENDLSPNVTIEILKPRDAQTYCRISPWNMDGVTKTTANPGDWITVDGSKISGMTQDSYADEFTKEVPLEWLSMTIAPIFTAQEGLSAIATFPQPTSANRPFSYILNVTRHESGRPSLPKAFPLEPEIAGRVMTNVVLRLPKGSLTDGSEYSATVTVNTQYKGVTATSVASNKIKAFDEFPADSELQTGGIALPEPEPLLPPGPPSTIDPQPPKEVS